MQVTSLCYMSKTRRYKGNAPGIVDSERTFS